MKPKMTIGGGYSSSGKQRDVTIDLLKGIGILLMVFRHTEAPFSEFVLLFHMAIFFIASGYLLRPEKVRDLKSLLGFIFKKIKGLWLPYFLFMAGFTVMNNCFIQLNFYTDNPLYIEEYTGRYAMLATRFSLIDVIKGIIKAALFRGNAQLGGAMWFFNALFLLVVGYSVIDYVLGKVIKRHQAIMLAQGIISLTFLFAGYAFHLMGKSAYGLNRFFSFYCLIYIGQMLRGKMTVILNRVSPWMIAAIGFLVLLVVRPLGYIDLSGNNIENPIYFLLVSVTGWFMMYSVAEMLRRSDFIGNKFISYLSLRSVPIIGLHFLSFKLVSWLAVEVYHMRHYMIAAFPVLMHGTWWILYMISGIAIPLLIDKVYLACKGKIIDLVYSNTAS